MSDADSPTVFAHLADGTILLRQADGDFRAVASQTDAQRMREMSEAEIERYASSDPDHPALDTAFWATVDSRRMPEDAVRLDADVLSYFRRGGEGYEHRINAALRHYVEAQTKS